MYSLFPLRCLDQSGEPTRAIALAILVDAIHVENA
jgi:hypothetical protein